MLLEDVVIWNSHQLQCHGRKTALSNGSKEQLAAVFTWRLVILTKTGIKLGFLLPHSLHFKFWGCVCEHDRNSHENIMGKKDASGSLYQPA